jgi:hypothetical protein
LNEEAPTAKPPSTYWHQQAASHRCLKLRRSAPLEKIIGIWSSCRKGKVHHFSRVHDIEGSADECLWDVVGIRDFNRTSGRLHYWHDDFLKLLIQQKSIYQAVFGLIEALPIPAPLLDLVEVGPIGLNAVMIQPRRFPPPWAMEDNGACYIVRDHSGRAAKLRLL